MARRWIPRLAALALAGGALWWWMQRRAAAPTAAPTAAPAATSPVLTATAAVWVPPVDGACPPGYPVKVAKSGIAHEPGGRFYDRTVPERCYATAAAAEADGYRRAKA